MNATIDAPIAQEPPKASFFEDLIDIIVSPARVFARRVDSSTILIIALFTALALVLAFANRGAMDGAVTAEIDRAVAKAIEANPQLTPEAMSPMRTWMTFMFSYGVAIGLPIYFVILALGVWLVAKIFGAQVGYGGALMITVWSFVPRFLGMILFMIQGLVMDTSTLKGLAQASFGAARFLDPATADPALVQLLARVEVFTFWSTILIGIGISVVGKVPRAKGYTAAAILWCLAAIPSVIQLLV
jgi:hypothetical protein